jgi:hypothetical protein
MAGEMVRMLRFRLGRALIHTGLRAFPPGRARDELTVVLWSWGNAVRAELANASRRP